MSLTGIIILLVYMVILIYIGYWFSHRQESISDFFVAGRTIPSWAALSAIVATETSAVTFIGAPAQLFAGREDFSFLQIVIGYIIARFILAFFFLPRFFEHEIVTIYQYLGRRFGLPVQKVAGMFFFLTRALAAGVRHFAAAVVIQAMTGLSVFSAIVLTGVISVIYAALGGISAVIWTEVIQFVVMLIGAVVAFFFLLYSIDGGMAEVLSVGAEQGRLVMMHWDWSGNGIWIGILGGFALNLATHGADQDLVQRLLSCKGLRSAQAAIIASGFVVFLQFGFLLFIGLMLFVYYGGLPEEVERANEILPYFAVNDMSPALGALLLAAILSAAMSSTASALNSLSSTSVNDFVMPRLKQELSPRKWVNISRGFTLFWMAVLIVIALISSTLRENILDLALSIPSYAYGSLLAAFLLGIFTRLNDQRAIISGMLVGVLAVTVLALQGVTWTWYVPVGAASSMLMAYIINFVLPESPSTSS